MRIKQYILKRINTLGSILCYRVSIRKTVNFRRHHGLHQIMQSVITQRRRFWDSLRKYGSTIHFERFCSPAGLLLGRWQRPCGRRRFCPFCHARQVRNWYEATSQHVFVPNRDLIDGPGHVVAFLRWWDFDDFASATAKWRAPLEPLFSSYRGGRNALLHATFVPSSATSGKRVRLWVGGLLVVPTRPRFIWAEGYVNEPGLHQYVAPLTTKTNLMRAFVFAFPFHGTVLRSSRAFLESLRSPENRVNTWRSFGSFHILAGRLRDVARRESRKSQLIHRLKELTDADKIDAGPASGGSPDPVV